MKKPWFKIVIATTFGTAVALGCLAEAIALGVVLPW